MELTVGTLQIPGPLCSSFFQAQTDHPAGRSAGCKQPRAAQNSGACRRDLPRRSGQRTCAQPGHCPWSFGPHPQPSFSLGGHARFINPPPRVCELYAGVRTPGAVLVFPGTFFSGRSWKIVGNNLLRDVLVHRPFSSLNGPMTDWKYSPATFVKCPPNRAHQVMFEVRIGAHR